MERKSGIAKLLTMISRPQTALRELKIEPMVPGLALVYSSAPIRRHKEVAVSRLS
jgi:hypothetical protein